MELLYCSFKIVVFFCFLMVIVVSVVDDGYDYSVEGFIYFVIIELFEVQKFFD